MSTTKPAERKTVPVQATRSRMSRFVVPSPLRPGEGSTLLRHLLWVAVAAVVVYFVSYGIDPFRNYQLATVAAYLCVTAGLTMLTGLNGQLSLGHGALMACGAYTVALAQNEFSDRDLFGPWRLPISLALGVLVAALAGALIGVCAARLRGPYLAGVTLAVALVVPAFTTRFADLFNADQGLSVYVDSPPAGLGPYFPPERWQAWIAIGAAMLSLLIVANLVNSRFGRAFKAVRDDEVAAKLVGIHVARTQVLAFVVSAGCAGLGGGVLAVISQSVSPSVFGLTLSLNLLLAIVLGGLGSLFGAAWGALLLVLLPYLTTEVTRGFELSPRLANKLEGNLPLAIFGLTLIIVMLVAPGGIQDAFRALGRTVRRRWRRT
ncbi:branched-chain amino acid transport system permease protein [Asanoa ferruginea]|uniref:Branched-chain amino acid transport system permease protein n=1 Tax=Asanoa ferruginea TaxID=53367 RepID=A0A3D9ZQR1_9ACTN|nr:branched-chain amino acid ABC transporter permease [Asanoa ferruginea]REF98974.1 branched-chain amino acid transport system permease protein [Asanoa ferruginea]GIF46344.1 branched-chain amino acid ABC transporter permease [Asanoa ferruginea]